MRYYEMKCVCIAGFLTTWHTFNCSSVGTCLRIVFGTCFRGGKGGCAWDVTRVDRFFREARQSFCRFVCLDFIVVRSFCHLIVCVVRVFDVIIIQQAQ